MIHGGEKRFCKKAVCKVRRYHEADGVYDRR